MADQHFAEYENSRRGTYAVCTCGWESRRVGKNNNERAEKEFARHVVWAARRQWQADLLDVATRLYEAMLPYDYPEWEELGDVLTRGKEYADG